MLEPEKPSVEDEPGTESGAERQEEYAGKLQEFIEATAQLLVHIQNPEKYSEKMETMSEAKDALDNFKEDYKGEMRPNKETTQKIIERVEELQKELVE